MLNVKIMLQRNITYYMWNVVLIESCLVAASLSVMLLLPEDFSDRMAISLTLLLTTVAFKQVVSGYLPSISYLTILDKYIIGGFLMQILVVAQSAWAKGLVDKQDDEADGAEVLGKVGLFAYFILYHLYFLLLGYYSLTRKSGLSWVLSFHDIKDPTPYKWSRVTHLPKKSRGEKSCCTSLFLLLFKDVAELGEFIYEGVRACWCWDR